MFTSRGQGPCARLRVEDEGMVAEPGAGTKDVSAADGPGSWCRLLAGRLTREVITSGQSQVRLEGAPPGMMPGIRQDDTATIMPATQPCRRAAVAATYRNLTSWTVGRPSVSVILSALGTTCSRNDGVYHSCGSNRVNAAK